MTPRIHEHTRGDRTVVRAADDRETILVLRGAISNAAEDDLRRALRAAIARGAAVVVLDLSEVEVLSSSARKLVAAAGSALADRGGVLLEWTTSHAAGGPVHVMRELRGAALASVERGEQRL